MWKPYNVPKISRRQKKAKLSKAQLIQLENWKQHALTPTLPTERKAATERLISMMQEGRLGPGSELLLKRTKTGKFLAHITQRSDADAAYLPNTGFWGIVVHKLGVRGAGRLHAVHKRKEVLKVIEDYTKAQPDNFKMLAFDVARFLHQNNGYKLTSIYDPLAESKIFDFYGRIAENSSDFSKRHPRAERETYVEYGKEFFRSIIRENLLTDFNFLLKSHIDPTKMDALRFALVGERIDPLTEQNDLRRISFVRDIFRKDVPELERFHEFTGAGDRALQALIRLRYKAMESLGTREAVYFYYDVCKHYKIPTRLVDRYAIQVYFGKVKFLKEGKPQYKEKAKIKYDQRAKDEANEHYDKERRVANAREEELRQRIEAIYGRANLIKFGGKTALSDADLKKLEDAEIENAWREREKQKLVAFIQEGGLHFKPRGR